MIANNFINKKTFRGFFYGHQKWLVHRNFAFGNVSVWYLEIRKAHEIVAEILSAKVNHLQFRRTSEYS